MKCARHSCLREEWGRSPELLVRKAGRVLVKPTASSGRGIWTQPPQAGGFGSRKFRIEVQAGAPDDRASCQEQTLRLRLPSDCVDGRGDSSLNG